jgi:hypothetical protein
MALPLLDKQLYVLSFGNMGFKNYCFSGHLGNMANNFGSVDHGPPGYFPKILLGAGLRVNLRWPG